MWDDRVKVIKLIQNINWCFPLNFSLQVEKSNPSEDWSPRRPYNFLGNCRLHESARIRDIVFWIRHTSLLVDVQMIILSPASGGLPFVVQCLLYEKALNS